MGALSCSALQQLAQHPYELPQLLVQPLQASAAYADWVRQETLPG